jgi:hypothetical protein
MGAQPRAQATANKSAEAVSLDMTGYWRPTVRDYLGCITKARILDAVRDAVSDEAAGRMADMKKRGMAEAAGQLLAGAGWLPAPLRTGRAAQGPAESLAGGCRRQRTLGPTPSRPSRWHGRGPTWSRRQVDPSIISAARPSAACSWSQLLKDSVDGTSNKRPRDQRFYGTTAKARCFDPGGSVGATVGPDRAEAAVAFA